MNGIESLPGLLDNTEYQLPSLPATRADFYIAPLRDPIPPHNKHVRSSFDSLPRQSDSGNSSAKKDLHLEDDTVDGPSRVSSKDKKKPHLAISELVDTQVADTQQSQLPSFVSLSAVERSPIPPPSYINSHKRIRPDSDSEIAHHEVNRLLPRPAAKDDRKTRPVPLLPAMVTGLHEPPPSAGLLPSMDLDAPPGPSRNSISKLQVKDMLSEPVQASDRRPPEAMLNSPEPGTVLLPKKLLDTILPSHRHEPEKDPDSDNVEQLQVGSSQESKQPRYSNVPFTRQHPESTTDTKPKGRRQRRIWTEQETLDLLSGVTKHGVGKWVSILADSAYQFNNRTSVDLKDRYRVYPKDKDNNPMPIEETKTQNLPNERSKPTPQGPDQRRKRTTWTKAEDEALVKGVTIHGFKWTAIHEDPDLGLGHRRPLVLKDHARHLLPDLYNDTSANPLKLRTKRDQAEAPTSSRLRSVNGIPEQEIAATTRKVEKPLTHVQSQQSDHVGVTLPRLDLDDELDWDNTLPPLLDWEELEI